MILRFPGAPSTTARERVGGKGASLIRLAAAGLPVPAGHVLTNDFFAPWMAAMATSLGERVDLADAVELQSERALRLPLTKDQLETLDQLHEALVADGIALVAVRSSAADEDAISASFAGIFESFLGVACDAVEPAVRRCFAASFEPRVSAYRRERGLQRSPNFAVVVQQQIDSEVAGVGFSLNPVNNDYDEAVFASSWGLGSSVVDGQVSADHLVVDKVSGARVEETLGDKRVAVRLADSGGVISQPESRASERALSDAQVAELVAILGQVESTFGGPVDIEWAFADGQLHLLQARAITTFIPLAPAMQTAPGEQRRIYLDAALSKGMTSNRPYSVLGLDQIARSFGGLITRWFGSVGDLSAADGLIAFAGSRMYSNMSDLLWLVSPARLAAGHRATDTLTADIIAGIDRKTYRSPRRPRWLNVGLLWRVPRALWRLRRLFWHLLQGLFAPAALHRRYQQTSAELLAWLGEQRQSEASLIDVQQALTARMARGFEVLMAALLFGLASPRLSLGRKAAQHQALLDATSRGVEGNVVVDMSLTLYAMARLIKQGDFDDVDSLTDRLQRRQLPEPLLSAWDDFIAHFGWRGAEEMDVASPRYADDPRIALRQMAAMATTDGFDLPANHQRFITEREHAYAELASKLGPLRRALLRRIRRWAGYFAGARDTPKHINVLANDVIRRRALAQGEALVAAGRLDSIEQVFDLTFEDLARAQREQALDLRTLAHQRSALQRRLRTQVRHFPPLIDSRGRVLAPLPRPEEPGVLRGMAVSAGTVRGPVRTLHSADGARIAPGDILIAYTTDPGWTPLFVNAAAVVLEVGGVLQHGAVVAREFGKPCVAGIAGIVKAFSDGDWVEVDGSAGTVRRVER